MEEELQSTSEYLTRRILFDENKGTADRKPLASERRCKRTTKVFVNESRESYSITLRIVRKAKNLPS